MNQFRGLFSPNRVFSKSAVRILACGQLAVFVLFWTFGTSAVIPKPMEVLQSLRELWGNGLAADLYVSLVLYVEAVVLSAVFSLLLAYASVIPFFGPLATLWEKFRFLGMVGLPFLFTLYLSGAHELKLALMIFGISVFMVTSMVDVVQSIPKEKYDLARTLRMGEWQVVWEVIVLGRIDVAFDVLRGSAAMGFMLLPFVESMFRSEGGIGAVLMTQNKYFRLSEVAAIQICILVIGLGQDAAIGAAKRLVCPYASLLLERR